MKAVIPYKSEINNGEELRFAIRSLVKHFKPLSEVIVVGDPPEWYKGPYIVCPDYPKRKEFSIYNKLIQVQDEVLYTNDDYFALQDFDQTLPFYYYKTCGEYWNPDVNYMRLYRNCPKHWLNFDIHVPMIIDTRAFDWFTDRPIKTYYVNTIGVQGTSLEDCKIRGNRTYDEVKQAIKNRPFFSTHENAKLSGVKQILHELYPDPSIYE